MSWVGRLSDSHPVSRGETTHMDANSKRQCVRWREERREEAAVPFLEEGKGSEQMYCFFEIFSGIIKCKINNQTNCVYSSPLQLRHQDRSITTIPSWRTNNIRAKGRGPSLSRAGGRWWHCSSTSPGSTSTSTSTTPTTTRHWNTVPYSRAAQSLIRLVGAEDYKVRKKWAYQTYVVVLT